jgi:hypothetical protein
VQCGVRQSDAYKNWTDGLAKSVGHVCPILPGSSTDFETGIFLPLRPILCNVVSVSRMLTKIGRTDWQKWSDVTKIGRILAVLCKRPFNDKEKGFITSVPGFQNDSSH